MAPIVATNELSVSVSEQEAKADLPWTAHYPAPMDKNFNYNLLYTAEGGSFADASKSKKRIAIIGCGAAGALAADELRRMGYKHVHVYEMDNRIGGRLNSQCHLAITEPNKKLSGGIPMEMAAMRMPQFNYKVGNTTYFNSMFFQIAGSMGMSWEEFPNPGGRRVDTGIYLNEGLAFKQDEDDGIPKMHIWPANSPTPPVPELAKMQVKTNKFTERITGELKKQYRTTGWPSFHEKFTENYIDIDYKAFARMKEPDESDRDKVGFFGGLNLSETEMRYYYAIGIGDGSWGAFFNIAALYPMRTSYFGFASDLKLIHGMFNEHGNYDPSDYYSKEGQRFITCNAGNDMQAPYYLGVQAVPEALIFSGMDNPRHPSNRKRSFWNIALHPGAVDGVEDYNYKFYSSTMVTKLDMTPLERVSLTSKNLNTNAESTQEYDDVILTVPSWAAELNIKLTGKYAGYETDYFPRKTQHALKTAHWERSCKVFLPLKATFFRENHSIPKTIVSDTFIHDMYAYRFDPKVMKDGENSGAWGVLLVSYTWEDDAQKFVQFANSDDGRDQLVLRCVAELQRVLDNSNLSGETNIYKYLDLSPTGLANCRVMHWEANPCTLGCAKLYYPGSSHKDAYNLMKFNQEHANKAHIYLAGEGFGMDAGWTEPALRGAMDALIYLVENDPDASFTRERFDITKYPRY